MSKTTSPPDYQTKLWINKGDQLKFPEKEVGVKQNTGVCFSGGGTRALSATMGQLRGLQALNLINSVDYISCVSGGSWASALYTYYKSNPNGKGPITDADFLGPVVPPHDIVVNKPSDPAENWLGKNDPKRMGTVATNSLLESLFGTLILWIGDYLLKKGEWPSFDSRTWSGRYRLHACSGVHKFLSGKDRKHDRFNAELMVFISLKLFDICTLKF